MSRKKIAYVISDVDKALAFEWVAVNLQLEFDLLFVLIGNKNTALANFLTTNSIRFYNVEDHRFSSYFTQWIMVFNILRKERPGIVHTHLWRANLIGLSVAWVLRVKQRIFTRHHATLHYSEFPSGRKWDIFCNWLATDIIAISKNIATILIDWDKASPTKITRIYHGFDLTYFASVNNVDVESLRKKYGLNETDRPIIGVISRYMEWKGIQYIIPAFKKILRRFPSARLILANAHGEFKKEITLLLQELPNKSVIEIQFEPQLAVLYRLFDVFVHVPIDPHVESFGQTYVEALAAGVPSVFTLSGIAAEFIQPNGNAWVVDFKKSDEIVEGVEALLTDNEVRNKFVNNGKQSVLQFSLQNHILALIKLYNKGSSS